MKTIARTCLPVIALLLLGISTAAAASATSPERDLVAVVSSAPLNDPDSVPGLVAGQAIMARLRGVLVSMRGGVPEAAQPELEALARKLHRLQRGDTLPEAYRRDGELWLPVRAQRLRVRLAAPDLRPRPGTPGALGNLPAPARRVAWLPVGRTARVLQRVPPLLHAGRPGRLRAQRLLEGVLETVRTRLVLEQRPLIQAYYRVEAALATVPHWDQGVRDRLRRAAEALTGEADHAGLAGRLQAQADRLTPDPRGLLDLALRLRRRIAETAAPPAVGGQR